MGDNLLISLDIMGINEYLHLPDNSKNGVACMKSEKLSYLKVSNAVPLLANTNQIYRLFIGNTAWVSTLI